MFRIHGKFSEIDGNLENHEKYLGLFKKTIREKLFNAIERSLANDPDVGKGRKKTVQVIFIFP